MNKTQSVTIFGMGYIGLPTAAIIAGKGIKVNGIDTNKSVLETLSEGKIHIVEPDLEGLVKIVIERNLLEVSKEVIPANTYMIAVPTPILPNKKPDTSMVEKVFETLTPYLKPDDLIILESTCPVGTTERMHQYILSKRPKLKDKLFMAYCPERVLPGKIIHELIYNDRILGGINSESAEKARQFYRQFIKGELLLTQAKTAEMCKLTENAFRDVNIAFANELSLIANETDIDVWELIGLANRHPRVNILQPGVGVGGHCIAVDPWFIVSEFPDNAKLIRTAREINLNKTDWVVEQIKQKAKTLGANPKIACMGVSFKPDIDDVRESPALYVVEKLKQEKLDLLIVEPNLHQHPDFALETIDNALNKANLMVFLVNHKLFRQIPIPNNLPIMDFCGVFK